MRKWGALRKAVLETWLAVLVLALSGVSASGEPVDAARAVLAAKGWYELRFGAGQEVTISDGKPGAVLAAEAARPIVVGGTTIAYAFDLPEGGCIAIAADDGLAPVFYYSLRGRLTVPGVPPAQAIMEAFAEKIVQLQDDRHRKTSTAHPLWASLARLSDAKRPAATLAELPATPKGPLLTTRWNQGAPYYDKCPTYQGQRCAVGCVATAMSQVMRYWQHPVRGTGTHSYYWSPDEPYWSPDGRVLSADFGSTTYDWANMPDEASSASPPVVKNAVSTLCYHCGVAVDMQYGPGGSGAWEYPYIGLKRYFGYECPRYAGRPDASRDEWYSIMCEQIDKSQPVLYLTRLHAFVLDGYDSPDLVHFNFGWGGQEDGWYPIDDPHADIGDPCFVDAIIDIRPQQTRTFSVFGSSRDPADGGVVISWTSQAGKTYQVYYTEDLGLGAVWNLLVPAMPGTGSVMSAKDTGDSGRAAPAGGAVKRRFYRVEEK